MPFPESQRVVFESNPITEVICQLRFPPILEIVANAPAEFQKNIRAEYPLYERNDATGVPKEFLALLSRMPAGAQISDAVVHKFATEDGRRHIALSKDFIALSETNYRRWEEFRGQLRSVLEIFERLYRPSFYQRTGLRYVNTIDRSKLGLREQAWSELLNEHFVGILRSQAVAAQVSMMQTQASVDISEQIAGGKATLRYGLNSVDEKADVFIIDSDFYVEGRSEVGNVIETLDTFNRMDGNLFRWAVRPDGPLWAALKPREIPN